MRLLIFALEAPRPEKSFHLVITHVAVVNFAIYEEFFLALNDDFFASIMTFSWVCAVFSMRSIMGMNGDPRLKKRKGAIFYESESPTDTKTTSRHPYSFECLSKTSPGNTESRQIHRST